MTDSSSATSSSTDSSSVDSGASPMIHIEGLTKRYGSKLAVDNLDLSIGSGEFFCYLGPNGAGKTTTIKVLTGLASATSGRVWVGGFDIARQPLEAKRLLGYVPDHPYLYERLTVRELMRFVAGLYRISPRGLDERIDELLEIFEILAVGDELVERLSHGMRQKLSFASTFLHQPRVVVVDEPWVGLDPKNIRRVKTYLKEQTRQGITVFMSTHSLSIAEELADRVGILHRGRLQHVGSVEQIKALASRPGSLEDVFLELTREDDDPAAAPAASLSAGGQS
ncbi:MAG: ABC transporter ATP-binding protein [Acidobacteriota bacterium]